jgi:uncharacterized repeat protein (TIGR01451 family)
MKKKISILVMMLLIIPCTISIADWDPEDGHKMHFPQLPDPNGWDVYATAGLADYPQIVLADDWKCSETGWVKDIHFWGSWLGDQEGIIDHFAIGVAANIPAGVDGIPYSRPGETLHEWGIYDWEVRGPYFGDQGFYFAYIPEAFLNDHEKYYQYNVFIDEADWFWQEEGTIYWLFLSAIVEFDPTGAQPLWGWKSSQNHWEDDACWAEWYILDWIDLWEPEPELIAENNFGVAMGFDNILLQWWATDYFGEGFYYYPNTNWWNVWFYDHPFDYDRYKEIHVEFEFLPYDPGISYAYVIVNWATDSWVPGEPPPVPPLTPGEEDLYVGRSPIGDEIIEPGFYSFDYTIPDYNPEWVSVDIMGSGFEIPFGTIIHECLPDDPPQSLDLAFVITGGPDEPCIDIEKKVWDEDNNDWVEEIDANINDIVEFNITVHNCGNPNLTNIKIVDTLPDCLEYVTGSSTVDGHTVDPIISGNKLTWTLLGPLSFCNTIEIRFQAKVISTGENINTVVGAADSPSGSVSATDNAIVNGIGTPSIDIDKKVSKDGGVTWSDEVEAVVCETVRFKITIHNDGDYDLRNIKVIDTLPDCLEYEDNAIPIEPSISGNTLTWNFPGPLIFCHTIIIEFDAHVISDGENINEVTVTADSDGGSVTGATTATVWAGGKPKPDLDCSGQLTWSNIKPGDTVTTTITVSNIGDPGSKLDWSVCSYPTGWGTWTFTPSSGTDLTPATSPQSITVAVVAPNEKSKTFTGEVKLCNDEDSTDTCTIQVSLATPKNKAINPFLPFLERLIERFPILEQILQPIYDKLVYL